MKRTTAIGQRLFQLSIALLAWMMTSAVVFYTLAVPEWTPVRIVQLLVSFGIGLIVLLILRMTPYTQLAPLNRAAVTVVNITLSFIIGAFIWIVLDTPWLEMCVFWILWPTLCWVFERFMQPPTANG